MNYPEASTVFAWASNRLSGPVNCEGWVRVLVSLLLLFVLEACTTVPVTERKQLSLVSENSLVSVSLQQYQQFLSSHEVVRNTSESEMVQRVGNRVREAVEQFLASRNRAEELADYQWEFNLMASPEANAWAMPGGKVAVYTGILPITRNEAGLAAVMGHEIAHVVAKHGNERVSQQLLTQMGGQALSAVLANQPETTQSLWMKVFGVGATVGVMLPYSRLQESEADHLGVLFMAMAGYDPHAAVEVWQRMAQESGGGGPEILSTHPADETRIREIQEIIPEAMRYYHPR